MLGLCEDYAGVGVYAMRGPCGSWGLSGLCVVYAGAMRELCGRGSGEAMRRLCRAVGAVRDSAGSMAGLCGGYAFRKVDAI